MKVGFSMIDATKLDEVKAVFEQIAATDVQQGTVMEKNKINERVVSVQSH